MRRRCPASPGIGKAHLAVGLGWEAIVAGYTVLFSGAMELVDVRGNTRNVGCGAGLPGTVFDTFAPGFEVDRTRVLDAAHDLGGAVFGKILAANDARRAVVGCAALNHGREADHALDLNRATNWRQANPATPWRRTCE